MATRQQFPKVKAARAADVCARFRLDDEARALLADGARPHEFLSALVAAGRYRSAIDFLAHALPPREAVWWGCLALKQASGPVLPPLEAAALKAATEWVLEPTEERRSAAKEPAEAAGMATPSGCLATAVAWTGGSLSPPIPKVPPVPPGPDLPAKGVAGAVLLASVRGEPARIAETQRLLVELGTGVAEGRFVWPSVKPVPAGKTWGRGRSA